MQTRDRGPRAAAGRDARSGPRRWAPLAPLPALVGNEPRGVSRRKPRGLRVWRSGDGALRTVTRPFVRRRVTPNAARPAGTVRWDLKTCPWTTHLSKLVLLRECRLWALSSKIMEW